MKKLLIINVFLLILLSSVYALNDNKINGYIKTSLFKNNITASLVADNENKISRLDAIKKKTIVSPKPHKVEDYGAVYNDVVKMIKTNYIENIDEDKFFEASLNGMLSSLDPHSAYFSIRMGDSHIRGFQMWWRQSPSRPSCEARSQRWDMQFGKESPWRNLRHPPKWHRGPLPALP